MGRRAARRRGEHHELLRTHQRRLRHTHLGLVLGTVLLLALLVPTRALYGPDHWLYDRMLPWTTAAPAADIVIVAIDDQSLRELGSWPWRRATLAALVESLTELGARNILLDLLLHQPDLVSPEDDRLLAQAMRRHGRVVLPVHVAPAEVPGQAVEILPTPQLAEAARALGHVSLEACADGRLRHVWLHAGARQPWWPHAALAMASETPADLLPRRGRDTRDEIARRDRRHIPFVGPSGSHYRVSALDLLAGRVPERAIRGRDVLVGVTAPVVGDRFRTPVDDRMAGVEVNASILQAVQDDALSRSASPGATFAFNLAGGLLLPLLLPLLRPRTGVLLGFGMVALLVLAQWAALDLFGVWLSLVPAMLVSLLALAVWSWRRPRIELRFHRAALALVMDPGDVARRIAAPGRPGAMLRVIERMLPVEAWRIEHEPGDVEAGGAQVDERAWQSSRARHYAFRRGGRNGELTLLWRDAPVPDHLDAWVRAMVRRLDEDRSWRGPGPVRSPALARVMPGLRALQAPGETLEIMLDVLTAGVVLCDACGSVLLANRQALAWLDLSPDRLDSLHLHDLPKRFAPPERDDWRKAVFEAMRSGRRTLLCRDPEGAVFQVNLRKVETGDLPGTTLLITMQDVTRAETAARVRDELLDYMSHDMRSPLISVLALLETARLDGAGEPLPFDALMRYVRQGLETSEQLLHLARLESTPELERVELDMLPVVENALEAVQEPARARDVRLRFHCRDDVPVWVAGQPEILERLLACLLAHAIEQSHAGGSVDVTLDADGDQVVCGIRDRGPGLAPEVRERLFGADAGSERRGTDFALRFVRLAARRHGGRIEAESRPGEGTRLVLRLPRVSPEGLDTAV